MPSGNQWLKVVRDQRLHLNRRIYRVELYDSHRKARLAVFRRATEAVSTICAGPVAGLRAIRVLLDRSRSSDRLAAQYHTNQ